MFNARSEIADSKNSFREAFKSKHCLIPATSYYKWTKAEDGGKDSPNIRLLDNEPFFFAGLQAYNETFDMISCTILTASAAKKTQILHDRMPIILKEKAWKDRSDLDTSTLLFDHCPSLSTK